MNKLEICFFALFFTAAYDILTIAKYPRAKQY